MGLLINNKQIGDYAEKFVCNFLKEKGLIPISYKFFVHNVGEIDIIMKKNNTVYFIEVKTRNKNDCFGGSIAALSKNKIMKIKSTAKIFLYNSPYYDYDVFFIYAALTHSSNGRIESIRLVEF